MKIEISENSDFSIHNIPFGIYSDGSTDKRACTAIGDYIVDLAALHDSGQILSWTFDNAVFKQPYLNDFMSFGKSHCDAVRNDIQSWLSTAELNESTTNIFKKQKEVTMHLPVKVGDYTDFYSSIEHATNIGKLFRDPENALLPNWRHLPVGYHGRASSIVVSGTPISRPNGQTKPMDSDTPIYGPSKRMDFELEMAFVIGQASKLGQSITTNEAENYIFGMLLFNDWSARDIQKWEYVPLGPFLGKSFASSVSPWIITMAALEPFRTEGPVQEPAVLPYLQYEGNKNYDINLTVDIQPEGGEAETISTSNFKYMYWNMAQQLAHHTINGCNVNVGDMMASGTISGKDESSYGSLLEISYGGKKPTTLKGGQQRTFIEDGDTITLKGYCEKDGKRVGFGEVSGKIVPNNSNT